MSGNAESGRCGTQTLGRVEWRPWALIEPRTGRTGGGSGPSPPGLQERGRMLLELLQAALAPGLLSPFPLPL